MHTFQAMLPSTRERTTPTAVSLLLSSACQTRLVKIQSICFPLCGSDVRRAQVIIKHPSIMNLSWLVLKKELLLKDTLGPLFAPSEHFLSCSTGIVPISCLRKHFTTKYNSEVLLAYLIKMKFCRELCDEAVLKLITNKESFFLAQKSTISFQVV